MYTYQHGGNAAFESGESMLDLSANINPLGPPMGVEKAIKAQLPFITRYPDSFSSELRNAIASFENAAADYIFCGNGASDIIFRLSALLKPKTALLPAPTFADYERALRVSNTTVYYHYLQENQGFYITGDIIGDIEKYDADIIFICNPNNPTGILIEPQLIELLLMRCEKINTFVVIDECFIDFIENSSSYTSKYLLKRYQNLIILKAFTKTFALPGIRLGYALCSNCKIIEGLYESGPDWAVSNIAQAAGIASLQSDVCNAYLNDTVAYIAQERAFLKSELGKLGFKIFDSSANYIFFKNLNTYNLFERLNQAQIRIRACGNYVGLTDIYSRVAVSTRQNNQKFIGVVTTL